MMICCQYVNQNVPYIRLPAPSPHPNMHVNSNECEAYANNTFLSISVKLLCVVCRSSEEQTCCRVYITETARSDLESLPVMTLS
jgi:hypothetical protein